VAKIATGDGILQEKGIIIDDFVARSARRSESRLLLVSNSGIFGLNPTPIEKGDKIDVSQGCCMHFVLCHAGDHYSFADHAYTNRYMLGKAIDEVEAGVRRLLLFYN
jgi:hypothetical protein